jgi:hypothetical protein
MGSPHRSVLAKRVVSRPRPARKKKVSPFEETPLSSHMKSILHVVVQDDQPGRLFQKLKIDIPFKAGGRDVSSYFCFNLQDFLSEA